MIVAGNFFFKCESYYKVFFAEVSQRSELQEMMSKIHLEEAGLFELSYGSPVSDAYSHNYKHTCEHHLS